MRFVSAALFFCLFVSISAQQSLPLLSSQQRADARAKALQKIRSQSPEQRLAWILQHYARVPKSVNDGLHKSTAVQTSRSSSRNAVKEVMPSHFSVPGEFEESQAVLLSWPYFAYDVDGNGLDPLTKDIGYLYTSSQGDYVLEPIAGYEVDTTETDYPLAPKWAELANAIQQEVPVWMLIYNDADSSVIKEYMANKGTPLTNCRFFNVGGGNAFWTRDFGPIAFYYGDQDSIGFIDPTYYVGRAADDSIPGIVAKQLGIPCVGTQLKYEGGNFMCDGDGNGFVSTMVNTINAEGYAQAYVTYDSASDSYTDVYPKRAVWSSSKTLDTLKGMFGLSKMTVLPTFLDDGGTGHIDMYTKLFDEETILSSQYPSVFNNSGFHDYSIGNKNIATERSTNTAFNRPYRVFTMPIPTSDDGSYDSVTSKTFGADPRGFLNGLTVNKTFIFPSFSGSGSGNDAQLQAVMELYKQYIPGYKLVPIDSRILTPMAGAIHCITMQVPVDNPLRIHHAAWRDNVSLLPNYPLSAIMTNRSGISTATVFWRHKGESSWQSIVMTSDSATRFLASIPGGDSSVSSQTIEYYLDGVANNGKHSTLPIVAPDGFFSFTFGALVGVNDALLGTGESTLFPNPAQDELNVPLHLSRAAGLSLRIVDELGRSVADIAIGELSAGANLSRLDIRSLPKGVYTLLVVVEGSIADSRIFCKN